MIWMQLGIQIIKDIHGRGKDIRALLLEPFGNFVRPSNLASTHPNRYNLTIHF